MSSRPYLMRTSANRAKGEGKGGDKERWRRERGKRKGNAVIAGFQAGGSAVQRLRAAAHVVEGSPCTVRPPEAVDRDAGPRGGRAGGLPLAPDKA